jgi:molybdopterin-binding protein
MRLSARNVLKGAVNAEVVIELPGGALITSIITKESALSLKLAEGQPAYAVIKASEVLVGVD